ncbi:MAG: NAD(P)H-binding protein [Rhodospirillaceae bacterium]|nr:NAD(P)H-binding protein [Rhodospirillaceae bacterium]MYB11919.1 NAD(P)H-binding protein [Rhodospirillaceae bacterium]MYI48628.1 NAD(P)H-binding protein [Rhodospirillaceae bacterium]
MSDRGLGVLYRFRRRGREPGEAFRFHPLLQEENPVSRTSRPRILVLGATGKVGGAVLRHLAGRDGIVVRAACRTEDARNRLQGVAQECVRFDFDAPGSYGSALDGVDRLFLLTGYSVDMLHHSKFLIDRAAEAGVTHVVHLGTHAPDDTAFRHHAWHQLVERYIEWRGLGFTHLRPGMFMVNILDYARANRDRPGVLVHYTGEARVAWVDVDDIGAAAARILGAPQDHRGRTYFLDSEAISMSEVAAILQAETGQDWRFEHRDAAELTPRLLAAGREATYASSGVAYFQAVAAGHAPDADRTHGTLERLIGRAPTRWADFAKRHRAEFLR